jgi:hypothetical protein
MTIAGVNIICSCAGWTATDGRPKVDNLKAQGFALRQLPPRFCSIAKLRFALPGLDIAQTEISPCPGIPGRVLDNRQRTTFGFGFNEMHI